ncbi:hypothetical protein OFC58_25435, partial [Escherichia coli]|nr:hypothetical protein [Escherichia coli]
MLPLGSLSSRHLDGGGQRYPQFQLQRCRLVLALDLSSLLAKRCHPLLKCVVLEIMRQLLQECDEFDG